MEMLYGAIDIHKHVFQAAVFDPASGEVVEQRFPATRERLGDWAIEWQGRLTAVAIEATSGWRWVVRELQQQGFVVQLADPGQAVALKGKRRRAKTDRLDARWLAMLLAKQMLPSSWIPPEEIQRLRDLTRLRLAQPGPHPLGATAARLPRPRRLALQPLQAAHRQRAAV